MRTSIFIYPIVFFFLSWGVGSFMRTISKIRGWNQKRMFWISAILYGSLVFVIYILGVSIPWFSESVYSVVIIGLMAFGIISPILNLGARLFIPSAFRKSRSNQTDVKSTFQEVVKKEPALERSGFNSSTGLASGNIFITYRRSDSADIAGRIYDRLIERFRKDLVFKDVDSIPLGIDFKEYLDKMVGECNVLLAIIGDRWLDASDKDGNKRLEDQLDFVRIEIESALTRGIPVIPLLVRGAVMSKEEKLPSSLRKLIYRNGIPIRPDPDFHRDMDRLIIGLEEHFNK